MKNLYKLLALTALVLGCSALDTASASAQTVCYRAHSQGVGWQGVVCDGQIGGRVGEDRRLEAIQIFNPSVGGEICYNVHLQGIGWQGPKCGGEVAGTTGQGRRIEAITVWYNNPPPGAELQFRAHLAYSGWEGIRHSGGMGGAEGLNRRIEALEVNVSRGQDVYWQ